MVTADIDDIDSRGFQLGDQRVEVLVTFGVGLKELFFSACFVESFLCLVGETFSVGGLVVQDGNVLALVVLCNEVAGDAALLVVAAANTECVPKLALSEGRVGGGRRDLEHATFGIGLGGRDRRR